MEYTTGFKSSIVRRLTGPTAISANALSQEIGINQPTLSRWLREAAAAGSVADMGKKNGRKSGLKRKRWTPAEKLRVIVESYKLDGNELGALLRREGIHMNDLEQWRTAAEGALGTRQVSAVEASLRERAETAEKALARNEKALAETAALLVLRGKAVALWGAADDDMDSTNAKLPRRSSNKP
jgi:transposase